ncbi:DotG/IcmE/VirB10 family type IV secretion system protein [Paraburkholderia sediminicola]|uniref:DotG/IcmE/VirB10 family protein n=1 Tax=Paraburkholderia sediminicola TaxID=458836 RepID=UPI0038BB883C
MAGNFKKKLENIKGAMGDGRTRGIYIASLALMIVAAVVAAVMYSRSQGRARSAETSQVAAVPDVTPNPAANGAAQPSTKWDQLVAQKNYDEAQQARQSGGSAVPSARPTSSDQPAPQPGSNGSAAASPAQSASQTAAADAAAAAAAASAAAAAEAQHRTAVDAYKKVMASQVDLLVKSWAPKTYQTSYASDKDVAQTTTSAQGPTAVSGGTASGGARGESGNLDASGSEKVFAQATDTFYGYMEMPANTDVKTPIKGSIVSGPLKGATFLAKIELPQGAEAALIHTTVIKIPGETKTLPFDAYLVDQNTMSTAMASDVDHHYISRWGSFAAATFLSGVSQAIMQAGQAQQVITTPTATVVAQNPLSTRQILAVGAGTIGAKAADHLGGLLDRPATVTVDAMPVGVLVMSDLIRK